MLNLGKAIVLRTYWPAKLIYINALIQNSDLAEQLMQYRAFTDIAFNPAKSFNCQARSAALFVSLTGTNQLRDSMSSIANSFSAVWLTNNETTLSTKIKVEQIRFDI